MVSNDIDSITPIAKIYLGHQRDLDSKYKNAVVMMAIGKFYEVYTYKMPDGSEVGRAKEVSQICNMQLTKKNKSIPSSMSNPYMCGFPVHSLTRYVSHLIKHSYTVAVYDQKEEGREIIRVLQGIYSPSVVMDTEDDLEMDELEKDDRGLMAVVCECFQDLTKSSVVSVIMVHINTSNGAVVCEEECFPDKQDATTFLVKCRDILNPQEVLWRGPDVMKDVFKDSVIHNLPEWVGDYRKFQEPEFHESFLVNIYPQENKHLSTIEWIGLERHPDLIPVFVHALHFLSEHHPLTIHRLQIPVFESRSERVFYNAPTIYDLNMIGSDTRKESMLSLLDKTVTPMGRRLLRRRLFSPHTSTVKLNELYDEVGAFINLVDTLKISNLPNHTLDVEHVMRRLQISSIASVQRVYRFIRFLIDISEYRDQIPQNILMYQEWMNHKHLIIKWEDFIRSIWDFQLMQAWRSWDTDNIWVETPTILLEKEEQLTRKDHEIRIWIDKTFGEGMRTKLVCAEEECYLQVTKKIFQELKDKHGVRTRTLSSAYRISHDNLDKYFYSRREILSFLVKTRRKIFQDQVAQMVMDHEDTLHFLIQMTAKLDVILSNASNVIEFRLTRPTPVEDENILSLQAVRHLIVEKSSSSKYITNNVDLEKSGILLFGQNSAGKCFRLGTKMVLFGGYLKNIEDLDPSTDMLIGDDGMPRKILAMTSGKGRLYNIVRSDTNQTLMTVNNEHILCLSDCDGSRIVKRTVQEVLDGKVEKYMLHQRTGLKNKIMSELWKTEYNIDDWTNQLTIYRKENMSDDEWRRVYFNILLNGRRVSFDTSKIKIERLVKNIIPFHIMNAGEYEFCGFGLDGNQRFLMPDGTMAHNSTLMKSVGVAVMMAQTGMFVPCSSMKWRPVHSLFTKIGSRDNIWKGKSTFITEMNELKHILDRSNDRSLILCDELTSGTEVYSASGIVASTIEHLLSQESHFIITTHLHLLKEFNTLMNNKKLCVMHLGMEHDKKNNKLVFNRLLQQGFGESIYGLEIAEYLGFSKGFLKSAYHYRTTLDQSSKVIPKMKRSRYNSKKWVSHCELCGSTTELHTHHIEPQALASPDGYINTQHKNTISNLQVLCRKCHEKTHHDHH